MLASPERKGKKTPRGIQTNTSLKVKLAPPFTILTYYRPTSRNGGMADSSSNPTHNINSVMFTPPVKTRTAAPYTPQTPQISQETNLTQNFPPTVNPLPTQTPQSNQTRKTTQENNHLPINHKTTAPPLPTNKNYPPC